MISKTGTSLTSQYTYTNLVCKKSKAFLYVYFTLELACLLGSYKPTEGGLCRARKKDSYYTAL